MQSWWNRRKFSCPFPDDDGYFRTYNDWRPAKIATGSAEVYGFTRNRSISAYRANKNADADNARDIHKAVNAGMHMVRVDCLDQIGP